mmetsp:Transcript_30658/g.76135  ORF Transcript_30658/g.76135 Transcript_30658/m.76135 type:complete len:210 (+) Transcript_30658:80-709(+)
MHVPLRCGWGCRCVLAAAAWPMGWPLGRRARGWRRSTPLTRRRRMPGREMNRTVCQGLKRRSSPQKPSSHATGWLLARKVVLVGWAPTSWLSSQAQRPASRRPACACPAAPTVAWWPSEWWRRMRMKPYPPTRQELRPLVDGGRRPCCRWADGPAWRRWLPLPHTLVPAPGTVLCARRGRPSRHHCQPCRPPYSSSGGCSDLPSASSHS